MTNSRNHNCLPNTIVQFLAANNFATVDRAFSISGGCIHQAYGVELSSGESLFVKTSPASAAHSVFESEALALERLAQNIPEGVPKVIAYNNSCLVLELLDTKDKNAAYWEGLAVLLAQLHRPIVVSFGFESDNFCGATPQPNHLTGNGYDFFAEHRLLFQVKKAADSGKCGQELVSDVEVLCNRLPELIPQMPPVLIHGDLWSGNCLNTSAGPKLIDPACYYGWAEAELAMTRLFGGFNESFYSSYEALAPLEKLSLIHI